MIKTSRTREVEIAWDGRRLTVRFLVGTLGSQEVRPVADAVLNEIEARHKRLREFVFDFDNIAYINSAGLGMVIQLRNRANSHGAITAAVGFSDDLKQLFDLMKLTRLFIIADTTRDLPRTLEKQV